MSIRTNLGKCNDPLIKELATKLQQNVIKAGEQITPSIGKNYYVTQNSARTQMKNRVGNVYKRYAKVGDEWFLHHRKVSNERGTYARGVDNYMDKPTETISLGGQGAFYKQESGNYIKPAQGQYPAIIATSQEMEAAIDYIKGHGSVENYTKLLRKY